MSVEFLRRYRLGRRVGMKRAMAASAALDQDFFIYKVGRVPEGALREWMDTWPEGSWSPHELGGFVVTVPGGDFRTELTLRLDADGRWEPCDSDHPQAVWFQERQGREHLWVRPGMVITYQHGQLMTHVPVTKLR